MMNTLKSHFCRIEVIILSLCTHRCYGRHNVSRKSVNHYSAYRNSVNIAFLHLFLYVQTNRRINIRI